MYTVPDNVSAGETFWVELVNVTLDSEPVLSIADVDTFDYAVLDAAGEPLAISGPLTPHPTIPGLWRAKLSIPTPQRVIISATATRGTSEGYWEVEAWIHPRS